VAPVNESGNCGGDSSSLVDNVGVRVVIGHVSWHCGIKLLLSQN